MPLDPYLAARLHLLDGVARPFQGPEDAGSRARQDAFLVDPAPWVLPRVDVRDVTVAGRHGPVPVRTYRPAGTPAAGSLVWAHGGGFARGELDWNEAHVVSAELAARAGVLVVSVDYRLAVDGVRFPVPVDDVVDVWAWLHAGDQRPPGRTAMGGASAGAALAMAAALRVQRQGTPPDDLLLAYPFVHFPVPALDDATAAEMASLPAALRFTPASIEAMVQGYVGRISDVPPLALPGHADVRGLPRTHLLVSEYDDLRPSAELLGRQLAACGVPVRSHLAAGMLHGHLNRTPALAEVDRSLDFFAQALRADTAGPGRRPGSTPGVRIVHLDAATYRALAEGDLVAANRTSPVPLTEDFVDPGWRGVWRVRWEQTVQDPPSAAWVTGVIWGEPEQVAVGRAGFHGPPDAAGMVEIGYAVAPGYRRRGFARAALESLLDRAARDPDVRTVRASIRPDNLPSLRLVAQYGFVQVGEQWDDEDGLELVLERDAVGGSRGSADRGPAD